MDWIRQVASLVVAFVLVVVCLFFNGSALGLIGPDEPRYAAIAQSMAESGDWVTPRLHGTPWLEKPILYYWTAAMAFRAFGTSEGVARLPSGLGALAAALALAFLGYGITSRGAYQTALLTLLVVPSTVAAIGFGRAASTDMLFAATLTFSLVCANKIVWRWPGTPTGAGWPLAWGAALGLAVLAKGPAAILLAGGSVALWAVVAGRLRDSFRLLHPAGMAAFAAVALPWYVLCALRNPDFIQVFLLSHNVERFFTPVFQHVQPFWFFGPILLLGLAPWVALLIPGVIEAVEALRLRRVHDSRGFFVLCWVIFPFGFFSVSSSKLPGYILPAVLPLAMLMARALGRALDERPGVARMTAGAVGATFLALAWSASIWQGKLPSEAIERMGNLNFLTTWVILVGASGLAIALLALRKRVWLALLLCGVVTGGLVAGILRVGALLDSDLSTRPAARQILRWRPGGDKVCIYKLHRAWEYGVNFYLKRAVPQWAEGTPADYLIVTSDEGLLDLLGRGYDVRIAARLNKRAILLFAEKPAGVIAR